MLLVLLPRSAPGIPDRQGRNKTMTKLKLSKDLPLPNETVTQKLAWLGTTGSGKTYGASKLAEQFWHIGAQFVVIDPVGVWYGLRLAKDGKKPSDITVPIFGGLHGDVPLESTAGALMANLVVDKDLSCIIDVSQFESDAEKARFATDFADRLFFRKKAAPSAMHLFLEECQEFVPQNPQRGEERMLHAFIRMQKLGRNFGIGSSYITQRPQEVNKKALNMAQTLFVFRTTGTHERTAIEKWIEDKSLDQNIAQDLPKLPTGTCHVWSPEFLKISETVHILEKETFNASATPEVGVAAKKRELAPIDLEKVRAEMAATIEKAKGEDPKLLRKEIVRLRAELGKGQKTDVSKTQERVLVKRIEIPAVGKRTLEGLKKTEASMRRILVAVKDANKRTVEHIVIIEKHLVKFSSELARLEQKQASAGVSPARTAVSTPPSTPRHKDAQVYHTDALPADASTITGPEQRILDGIAWTESIGIPKPSNEIAAFLSGYAHCRSAGYTNPRASLRSKGLIEYSSGRVAFTSAGRALAIAPTTPLSQEELHRSVLERLAGPEKRVLQPLLKSYPDGMSNTDLSATAGYAHERSAGYTNPRSRLRSFGLIKYEDGEVKAADILFL